MTVPGASRPKRIRVRLYPQDQARLHVRSRGGGPLAWRLEHFQGGRLAQKLRAALLDLAAVRGLGLALTGLCLLLALTWGLTRFPAQVDPAELFPSLGARELLDLHLRNNAGDLLPALVNGTRGDFTAGAGVYFLLRAVTDGFSLTLVRGLTAFFSLAALAGLALAARRTAKAAWVYWLPLFFAATPFWLYYARTGSEEAQGAALAMLALAFYSLYLSGWQPGVLAAALSGALAFYAAPGLRQSLPLAALLLIFLHWKQHRQARPWSVIALAAALLGLLPLLRLWLAHPEAVRAGLTSLTPIWNPDDHFAAAFSAVRHNLGLILSPQTWYSGRNIESEGLFAGQPLLPLLYLPLSALGVGRMLWRWRNPQARLLLAGLIAAACGPALYRLTLADLLPLAWMLILSAFCGLAWPLDWLLARWPSARRWLTPALTVLLAALSLTYAFTRSANNAAGQVFLYPQQIFRQLETYLAVHPDQNVIISESWGNDVETCRRFFAPQTRAIHGLNLDDFRYQINPALQDAVMVLTPAEYDGLIASGKFSAEWTQPLWPDAQAFLLARITYTAQAADILAQESQQRHALAYASLPDVFGAQARAAYSQLDIGPIDSVFDGDENSLIRTAAANPLVIELTWDQPRTLSGLSLRIFADEMQVRAVLNPAQAGPSTEIFADYPSAADTRTVTLDFGAAQTIRSLRIEFYDPNRTEPTNVHLWEITAIPAQSSTQEAP